MQDRAEFDQPPLWTESPSGGLWSASRAWTLTLILLSFAQFERELISERTRDKMSAARRKGKWVGGCPVLGYDVDPAGGRLVVNEEEAERVRAIGLASEEDWYRAQRNPFNFVKMTLNRWVAAHWATEIQEEFRLHLTLSTSLDRYFTDQEPTATSEL